MKQISSSRKTLIIENKGKSLIDMKLVSTGIESRKRFYSEINQQPEEYQPKRGMMNNLYQMIRHPIEYFKPKETKMSEMKIEVKKNEKNVNILLSLLTGGETISLGQIHVTEKSNIETKLQKLTEEVTNFIESQLDMEKNELIQQQLRKLNENGNEVEDEQHEEEHEEQQHEVEQQEE